MARGRIRYQRSILSAAAVRELAELYKIELGLIAVASRTDRVCYPPEGWVGLYLDYFKEGFQILVSQFFLEAITYYKIHVSQLTPNAVGRILILMCCAGVKIGSIR